MQVSFYTFSKRRNSLAVPDSVGTAVDVRLKEGTNVLSPVLLLSGYENPTDWNYVSIPELGGRLYYVTSWESWRDLWRCYLSVDVLGSYRNAIRNTTALVIFSSSSYSLDLIDNRIPAQGSFTENSTDYDMQGTLSGAETTPVGMFALTTMAKDSDYATGVTTTYFLSWSNMSAFAKAMLEPSFIEELKQYFINPFDGLIDCYYLPVNVGTFVALGVPSPIWLGAYQVPGGAVGVQPRATSLAVHSLTRTMEIPWIYNDFRNLHPYTNIEIFVPFCGSKAIDTAEVYGTSEIKMEYSVDVSTGAVQAVAYNSNKKVLGEWSGNCKVSLPLAQSQSRAESLIGVTGAAVTSVAGAASGNAAMVASGALSAISSAIQPTQVKSMGGMSGSVLGAVLGNDRTLFQNFRITVTSRNTPESPSGIRGVQGNACNAVRTLSSLSGYCQTSGFSVSAPAFQSEIDEINSMLDSGVYL